MTSPKHRRPVFLDHDTFVPSDETCSDPTDMVAAAHRTAWLIADPDGSPHKTDPEVKQRVRNLATQEGLILLADLWREAAPLTLPGALWRLYVIATWVRAHPQQAAKEFEAGENAAPVSHAIAGLQSAADPEQVLDMVNRLLTRLGSVDVADVLDQVGAFALVVATGRGVLGSDNEVAGAVRLLDAGRELHAAAKLWRNQRLL